MRYLTLQDVIWINTAVTGSPRRYDYDRLENAVYSQYAYGDSRDAIAQAANLLDCLIHYKPFTEGNELTALVATLAFLRLNGFAIQLDAGEVESLMAQLAQQQVHPKGLLEQRVQQVPPSNEPLRTLVAAVCHSLRLPMKAAQVEVH